MIKGNSVKVRWTANYYRLSLSSKGCQKVNDCRDQITFEKTANRGGARCFPEIKFEQIFWMMQPSAKVSIMLWMGTELLLLFIFPSISAQNSELPAVMDGDMLTKFAYQPGPTYLSLILLALTVGLSGSVYLCVLRYICTGCCQPVVVGPEDESMSGVV